MKIKKILLFTGLGLVVVVVITLLVVALCLDGIVKKGVETVGPKLVQVPITLDSIHIGVLSGSAKVKGLVVGNPDGSNAQVTASGKPAKKLEVDDFLITGAKVHVTLTLLGGKEMTLPLPDIHLTDLGKGDAGLTPADLTSRVLEAITSATLDTVKNSAGDLGKGVENVGKGAVNKITSGLGGLFK